LIEFARLADSAARTVRKIIETQDEIRQQAHAQIAKVRFAVEGTSTYPDATFTLRLAYGLVQGYEENGQAIPSHTTFAGLLWRSAAQGEREPFDLPPRWLERKRVESAHAVQLRQHGGHHRWQFRQPGRESRRGLVGIIFDGNISRSSRLLLHREQGGRCPWIREPSSRPWADLYQADRLADELQGKRRPS
jgi:hypothetical protein